MMNYLFGLLSGIIVGLFLNQSLRYIAQLFFLKRIEKLMRRLETEATKALVMGYGVNGPSNRPTVSNVGINTKVN